MQQGGDLAHVLAQAVADFAHVHIGAHDAGGDDDDEFGACAVGVGAAKEVADNGDVVQPGYAAFAFGGAFLDEAAHDDGFARAHGDAAGDLALQEAALLGDFVFGTYVGDGLVDGHGDEVAGVYRRGDF